MSEFLTFLLSLDSTIHYQGFSNSWSPILQLSLFESLFLLCWGRNARNESVIWCMQHSTFAVAFLADTAGRNTLHEAYLAMYVCTWLHCGFQCRQCVHVHYKITSVFDVRMYDPGWSGRSVCKSTQWGPSLSLAFPSLFFATSLYASLLLFLFLPFPPSSPPFLPTVTARRLLFITSLVRCWWEQRDTCPWISRKETNHLIWTKGEQAYPSTVSVRSCLVLHT